LTLAAVGFRRSRSSAIALSKVIASEYVGYVLLTYSRMSESRSTASRISRESMTLIRMCPM